jgi:hypothetical protein
LENAITITTDISTLLHFSFWEEVYFTRVLIGLPLESTEELGNFVGFGESVGGAMTFKVPVRDSQKIIYRSNVRSASNPAHKNLCFSTDGEFQTFIQSKSENHSSATEYLPALNELYRPSKFLGKSFLGAKQEDGQRFRLKIIKAIADQCESMDQHPEMVKFLVENTNNQVKHILTYNDIIEYLSRDCDDDDNSVHEQFMKFCSITAHQGPLTSKDR